MSFRMITKAKTSVTEPNEASQRMDCGESLVAGRDGAPSFLLQVKEEKTDDIRRDIVDRKLVRWLVDTGDNEGK